MDDFQGLQDGRRGLYQLSQNTFEYNETRKVRYQAMYQYRLIIQANECCPCALWVRLIIPLQIPVGLPEKAGVQDE